jgi:RNA polymerase sigma-70 factor (ECF subfamily)
VRGSDREIEALYRRHRAALYRYATWFTGDPDLAEDVVQETFLRAHERTPRGAESIRGWLFTVATNLARDTLRVARRRRELLSEQGDMLPAPAAAPDAVAQLEREELGARLRAALDRLSERERSVLLLRHEGFRHREIAEAVGTTTKSVGTMIARAADKVALALGPEGDR